jgi:hypothetical protein
MSWPRQPRPTNKDWIVWQSFLRHAIIARGLRLKHPLGHWTRSEPGWEWFFSPSEGRLFQVHNDTWKAFASIIKKNRLPSFSNHGIRKPPPRDLCRASVYFNKSKVICTGYAPMCKVIVSKSEYFSQYLQEAAVGERWCFSHMDMGDEGQTIATALQHGEVIAVSDGSFQDTFGLSAWVVEGANELSRATGAVVVPGAAKDQSAYRSELAGIFSIMIFIKKLCEFYNISSGAIELGCDGQSTLDKAFNYVALIHLEEPNHDILHALCTLWAQSPISWKFKHVRGHQDDRSSIESLDRWAKLNVEMDTKAKRHMTIAKRTPWHYLFDCLRTMVTMVQGEEDYRAPAYHSL